MNKKVLIAAIAAIVIFLAIAIVKTWPLPNEDKPDLIEQGYTQK